MVPFRLSAPTFWSQSRYVIPLGNEVSIAKLPIPSAVDVPSQVATFLKSAGPVLEPRVVVVAREDLPALVRASREEPVTPVGGLVCVFSAHSQERITMS